MQDYKDSDVVNVRCALCHRNLGQMKVQDLKEGKVKCECFNNTARYVIGIKCRVCNEILGSVVEGKNFVALKCQKCNRFECFGSKEF